MASCPGEVVDLDALVSVHDAVAQGTAPSGLAWEAEGRPLQCLLVQRRAGGLLLAFTHCCLSEDRWASGRLAGPDELVGPSLEAYTSRQGTDGNGFMAGYRSRRHLCGEHQSVDLRGAGLLATPHGHGLAKLCRDETLTAGYSIPEDPSQAEAADLSSAAPAAVPPPARPKRLAPLLNAVPKLSHRLEAPEK